MIEAGATVFFQHPEHSWVVGAVDAWDGKVAVCRAADAKEGRDPVANLREAQLFVARDDLLQEDVNDLLNLTVLHDATLLNCLKRRYLKDIIYTNIGAIVVALNPFNFTIPWYMDDKMEGYLSEGDTIERNLPHSWAVAHNTYFEMRNDRQNQSVLVSGESGAGKTEASKIVMKYLGAVSARTGTEEQRSRGRSVGEKINCSSLPLEAFGNAKTVRNDNSSRFGKFMTIKFDDAGYLVGAFITKYLLEKSRIVTAADKERVYHALYLATRGAEAARLGISDDASLRVLNAGKTLHNKEYDTQQDFDEVSDAMMKIGITKPEISSIWAAVAGVLLLGNVSFTPRDEGSVVSEETRPYIARAAAVLQIDGEVLEKELLTWTLTVGGQVIVKLLNPIAALDSKEALMKALYDCEFQWLVDKCNAMLDSAECAAWIGLLDIFGFEDFEVNSFEQLCINLTNETLQGHYNDYIFKRDMEECRAEGVDMSQVEFPDNGPCIAMITANGGILSLLDEECALGKASDMTFLAKVTTQCTGNPFFVRKALQKSSFTIKHYAGDVSYEVLGFLDKNRDTLKDAFKLLMRASHDELIAKLLPEPTDARRMTVGTFFKNQLQQLMGVLTSTNPHWIRCVKPHPAKKPLMWHGVSVMNQLSSSGVLGTVKIRKAGYPVRVKIPDFVARYSILGKSPRAILDAANIVGLQSQIGTVRVFLKGEAYVQLEKAKKEALQTFAKTIQSFFQSAQLVNAFREKQRVAFGSFIEEVRAAAKRLLAYQYAAASRRAALEDHATTSKAELKSRYDAKMKELLEDFHAFQRQQNRIEYERKKKLLEEQAEKQRKEQARRDAKERLERQKEEEARELRELQAKAELARRQKREQEEQMALLVQAQVERHLCEKATETFSRRQERQIEDREKLNAARERRMMLENQTLRVKHAMLMETETSAARGAIAKAQAQMQMQHAREEQRLRAEGRRREMAEKLQEEREHKQRFTTLRLATSEAKHAYLTELREQQQRDSNEQQRLQKLESSRVEAHMQRIHRRAAATEYKELKNTRVGLERAQRTIETMQRQDEAEQRLQRRATTSAAPAASARYVDPADGGGAHVKNQIQSVRMRVRELGTTAFRTTSTARAVRRDFVDPRRRALDRLQELVTPEVEEMYQRLQKSSHAEIMKYALAVPPHKPLQDLPWKI